VTQVVSMLPEAKLDIMLARHASLEAELSRPLGADTYVRLTRELAEIAPVVEKVKAYRNAVADLAELDAIIADPATEPDLRDVATEEKPVVEARRGALEQDIRLALIPKDAMDDKNVILEIRAGTGGKPARCEAVMDVRVDDVRTEGPPTKADPTRLLRGRSLRRNEVGRGG